MGQSDATAGAEARRPIALERIIDLTPDAYITVDATDRIVLFNMGAARIFGYRPEEVLGQPLDILLPERCVAAHRQAVRRFAGRAQPGCSVPMEPQHRVAGRRRDGQEFPAEVTLIKLVDSGQTFCTAIVRDISARCRAEVERRQADEALHHYATRLHMLYDISRSILTAQSPEAIAEATVRRLRHLVSCQYIGVVSCVEAPNTPTVLAADLADLPRLPSGERLTLAIVADLGLMCQGQLQQLADILAVPDPPPALQDLCAVGLRSLLSVPLVAHSTLIGTLSLAALAPGAFTADHVDIAVEVADQLAVAIQNARLFAEVRAGQEQLQELSHRLIEAQEAERRAIAAELHDQIGQALTIVKLTLQAIPVPVGDAALSPYLAESVGAVERVLQQVRNLSLDLRPPMLDDLGLVAALRWYATRQARLAGFALQFQVAAIPGRLPTLLETACFRLAQEALTNVVRHARARQVSLMLSWSEGELILRISDDGVGFDARSAQARASRGASLGLLGMRERALIAGGRLVIQSSPGCGTTIQARFPLAALPPPDADSLEEAV